MNGSGGEGEGEVKVVGGKSGGESEGDVWEEWW